MSQKQLSSPKSHATGRESNIELFRIITMFFIIAHHYVVNSGLTAGGPVYENPLSQTSLFLLIWGAFGKIGINCFVLITGYFMCVSKISAKKFAKLFFEMMFYRIIIALIFWCSGYAPLTTRSLLNCLIPFTQISGNFTETYLLFFLCIPFLNILINNLREKQHIRLIILSMFIYVLFGTLPFLSVDMNYISWYIVLYFIASYIRLYPKHCFSNIKLWGAASAICVLLCCASVPFGAWLGNKLNMVLCYFFVTDCNTFLALLTGICTFMFFKNIKMKQNKFINAISSTTFGVLLIHANSDTMRKWLWKDVLKNVEMYNSEWIYFHAIFSVIAIFALCSLIDLLRIRFIEKPFFVLWDKYYAKIASAYTTLEDKLCRKFNIGE